MGPFRSVGKQSCGMALNIRAAYVSVVRPYNELMVHIIGLSPRVAGLKRRGSEAYFDWIFYIPNSYPQLPHPPLLSGIGTDVKM